MSRNSLRQLLGYDPKSIKPNSVTPRVTPAPVPSAYNARMTSKKYQIPMSKVKRLPPISEEGSSPSHTPRPLPNSGLKRLSKQQFKFKPTTSKPVIPVKPTPRPKKSYQQFSPRPKDGNTYDPAAPPEPLDINHTLVDGLVADYLHYARYAHVIPMYEGTSVSTCPCCTDRNRQNVRTLLGFPADVKEPRKEPPRKYDSNSKIEPKPESELTSETSMYPNSLYAKQKKDEARIPSESDRKIHAIALEAQKRSWMSYQPLPYATNYLNPEFNRPDVLNNYFIERPSKDYNYIAGEVMVADSDYKDAMDRLERLSFGARS